MFTSNGLIHICNRVCLDSPTLIRELNSFSPGLIFLWRNIFFWHWNALQLPRFPCCFWEKKEKSISILMSNGRQYISPYLRADILFHLLPLNGWTLKLGIYFITPFGPCPRLSSNKNRLNNGVVSDWKIPGKRARTQYLKNIILPFPVAMNNSHIHQCISSLSATDTQWFIRSLGSAPGQDMLLRRPTYQYKVVGTQQHCFRKDQHRKF